ncbi:hypothetical protein NKG94_14770 [Micromonospora sp. M12]
MWRRSSTRSTPAAGPRTPHRSPSAPGAHGALPGDRHGGELLHRAVGDVHRGGRRHRRLPGLGHRATVVIDGDDTGVPNVDTGDGCTINDLIDENADHSGHAAFVRHVEAVTAALVTGGTLDRRQQGAIVRAAARSDVGA